MRIWPFQGDATKASGGPPGRSVWTTETKTISSGDVRPLIMILGVWLGFMLAIHYAGTAKLYAAVDKINHYLNPIFESNASPVPQDHEALIVTADRAAELSAVATLSPRGFHPVIASNTADALKLLRETGRTWKIAVLDASLPEYKLLASALIAEIPPASIVTLTGREHPQAVSRALLDRIE